MPLPCHAMTPCMPRHAMHAMTPFMPSHEVSHDSPAMPRHACHARSCFTSAPLTWLDWALHPPNSVAFKNTWRSATCHASRRSCKDSDGQATPPVSTHTLTAKRLATKTTYVIKRVVRTKRMALGLIASPVESGHSDCLRTIRARRTCESMRPSSTKCCKNGRLYS